MIIQIKTYAHSDKDSNYDMMEQLEKEHGFKFAEKSKKLNEQLPYLNYEVKLVYEIDTLMDTIKLISVEAGKNNSLP